MTVDPPVYLSLISLHAACALTVTFLFTLPLTPLTSALTPDRYHDYCVVGAGPAGLQMGYFFKKANRDYMIFERSNDSGHFFVKYPRHRTLISINKRNTGQTNKEFNLRHDWNSLLSDDDSLLFTKYTKQMFPSADRMLDYLRDYQHKLGLNVQWNTEVGHIHTVQNLSAPDGVLHVFHDQRGQQYSCKVLVLATGMWKPNVPDITGMELVVGYEDMSVDPEDYEGKAVLILGHGNSAFEVAQDLYGVTNMVHVVGRNRVRLSWQTHYVGDVRAVNMELIDTYQLKSLDGIAEARKQLVGKILREGNKLKVKHANNLVFENFPFRDSYDIIIRCLGFNFDTSIFRNKSGSGNSKYLPIYNNYEYRFMPGVFVAGTASHSLDYRRSAGGFIHGFRYTARALSRLLEWRYEGVPWPSQKLGLPVSQLVNVVMGRLNEASGPYQMFQVLADVVLFSEDRKTFDYLEEFPVKLLHELPRHTGRAAVSVLVVMLQYGDDYSGPGKDTLKNGRSTGSPELAHQSNFLHPVIYYYNPLPTEKQMKNCSDKDVLPPPQAIHHIVEDFLTRWDGHSLHMTPLRHFLENTLSSDLRHRFDVNCFHEAMTRGQASPPCQDYLLQDRVLIHQGAGHWS